jgi:hypothetical protein
MICLVLAWAAGARLRHIALPQIAPHAAGAARTGLALVWKIGMVGEFLSRPNSVGFKIHLNLQLFDVGRVLVYALSFVAVMLALEKLAATGGAARPALARGRSALSLAMRGFAFGGAAAPGPIVFNVTAGQMLAILGPSSGGKLTLPRLAAGLITAPGGVIARPDNIAMAFQEPVLLPWRSAADNIAIAARSIRGLRWKKSG